MSATIRLSSKLPGDVADTFLRVVPHPDAEVYVFGADDDEEARR